MKARVYQVGSGASTRKGSVVPASRLFAKFFSSTFKSKKDSYEVTYDPLLKKDAKIVLPINMGKYLGKPKESSAVIEKRRAEYDDSLSMLFDSTSKMLRDGTVQSVDVIATTELHHDWEPDQIKEIEAHFLNTHQEVLKAQTRAYTWNAWIASRVVADSGNDTRLSRFDDIYQSIVDASAEGSRWYQLMVEAHQQTRMGGTLQDSLIYQRREYAAIRLMADYTNVVYMGPLSQAWSYLYTLYADKESLPLFTGATIRKRRLGLFEGDVLPSKKTASPVHPAIAMLEENVKSMLFNDSISKEDKQHLAATMQSLLYGYPSLWKDDSSGKKKEKDQNGSKSRIGL